ncbi:MAG TPA: CinA family protein [Burkholderiales bacterium]|nr:CinA family protein [Burkholderiales bacterium]
MERLLPHARQVGELLKERKQTVAVAESSAGGLISAALLAVPGASAYFRGGAVTYTRHVLLALKNLDKDQWGELQAATEAYALFEARTVREHFGADWGIGESGAAGPTGNRYGNPPGHSCVGVCGATEQALTLNTGSSDRVANMYAFAECALKLLAASLRKSG